MVNSKRFQDMLNENSAEFLGLSAFLQKSLEGGRLDDADLKAVDPILAKYFNGMPPKELLSQFEQHVQAEKYKARLKLAPSNSGIRKELADEYIPTIKPYKPF